MALRGAFVTDWLISNTTTRCSHLPPSIMGKLRGRALQPFQYIAAIKNDFTPLNPNLMVSRGRLTIFKPRRPGSKISPIKAQGRRV
jgi:hypothetical protein